MNFSIKHWLTQNYIEISNFKNLSPGNIAGLALRIITDESIESIGAFDICIVAELFEQPLAIYSEDITRDIIWEEISVFTSFAESLLDCLNRKSPLTRAEATWFAFQTAFLIGLRQIITTEVKLQRNWLQRAIIPLQTRKNILSKNTRLQGLLKNLNSNSLSDTQAEQVLSQVTNSFLVRQMTDAAVCWLVANGSEEQQAKLILQRLLNSFEGYLLKVTIENPLSLVQLQKFVGLGKTSVETKSETNHREDAQICGEKIDIYREYYRVSLFQSLSQPLFTEFFTLKDIYVNLRGIPISVTNDAITTAVPGTIDLRQWSQQQLTDLDHIAVIESEQGFGKTSFCQIWAAEIAWKLYPQWLPILIPLRKIKYGSNLIETLSFGLPQEYRTNFKFWLRQANLQCLLLLDGWDELPPSPLNNRNAKSIFLKQLLQFQQQGKHKVLLTTRSNSFPPIDTLEISAEFSYQRIAIAQLEQKELKQWFQNWAKVQSWNSAQNCFNFLKQTGAFSNHSPLLRRKMANSEVTDVPQSNLTVLASFVRQPLMLFLIAILYRDGFLDDELLNLATNFSSQPVRMEWEIYQRLHNLLLGYPLPDGTKNIILRATREHIHHLGSSSLVNEISTSCGDLDQSRNEQILEAIENMALSMLLCDRHHVAFGSGGNAEKNSTMGLLDKKFLPAFYFHVEDKPPKDKTEISTVEFSHSQLGEYLKAQALVNRLVEITKVNSNSEYNSESSSCLNSYLNFAQQIYNLLGYGILTEKLEALVIEGLRRKQIDSNFSLEVLRVNLQKFWLAYCRGDWLDEGIVNQTLQYFREFNNHLNIEKINAATGFNVFLLLCAFHKEMKVAFLTSTHCEDKLEFDAEAIRILICRMEALSVNGFIKYFGYRTSLTFLNLSNINLSQTRLTDINLEKANLSHSQLVNTNLARTNLQGTNLTGANLAGANLTQANLTESDLTGANLAGANLTGVDLEKNVNLTNACLFQTTISETNKEIAILNGATFSLREFQVIHNLTAGKSYIDSPDTLSDADTWLYNNQQIGKIESAEGEPLLPIDLQTDIDHDETLFRADIGD